MATVVKGTASSVRYTINVSGNRDGVSTKHHTIFKVGNTTVMFTSGSPPVIGDGDQLIVAGKLRGRVLVAEAYVNRTVMIRGDSGLWYSFIGAAIFLPVGVTALVVSLLGPLIPPLPHLDMVEQLMILAIGLTSFGSGLYLLYRWLLIRSAVKMVKGD